MAGVYKSVAVTVANDATYTLAVGDAAMIVVANHNIGDGAAFCVDYDSASTTMFASPSGAFQPNDNDGEGNVYTGANRNSHTFKNRLGTSYTFGLTTYGSG